MTDEAVSRERQPRLDFKLALISAGAALLGALAGALTSYFIAVRTIDAQHAENLDQFLRSQRQTAYSKLLTDDQDSMSFQQAISDGLKASPIDFASIQQQLNRGHAADYARQGDLSNVLLLADNSTVIQSAVTLATMQEPFSELNTLINCASATKHVPDATCKKAQADLDTSEQNEVLYRIKFIGAAKSDVGD